MDAIILVFSLENEASFLEVYKIYHQLSIHRPVTEIPFVVVGTQGKILAHNMSFDLNLLRGELLLYLCFLLSADKISSTNPRVIDDARARQLCSDVRRCTYYETCATYGLNVNRVFTDGMLPCHTRTERIIQQSSKISEGFFLFLVLMLQVFFPSAAAQKIMAAKKQAALLASCKSLPNSPSHSGGSTPVSGIFPGQVKLLSTICQKEMVQSNTI